VRGSPIRTPSDQRSVGSSPRHIAASHVLHRLLVPRHPPCALNILTTQNPTPTRPKTMPGAGHLQANTLQNRDQKMLASTVQFSTTNPRTLHTTPPAPRTLGRSETRKARTETTTPPAAGSHPQQEGPLPQDPTACLRPPPTPDSPPRPLPRRTPSSTRSRPAPAAELVSVPPSSTVTSTRGHPVVGDRHDPRTALDRTDCVRRPGAP
jgi:hypothetical protein